MLCLASTCTAKVAAKARQRGQLVATRGSRNTRKCHPALLLCRGMPRPCSTSSTTGEVKRQCRGHITRRTRSKHMEGVPLRTPHPLRSRPNGPTPWQRHCHGACRPGTAQKTRHPAYALGSFLGSCLSLWLDQNAPSSHKQRRRSLACTHGREPCAVSLRVMFRACKRWHGLQHLLPLLRRLGWRCLCLCELCVEPAKRFHENAGPQPPHTPAPTRTHGRTSTTQHTHTHIYICTYQFTAAAKQMARMHMMPAWIAMFAAVVQAMTTRVSTRAASVTLIMRTRRLAVRNPGTTASLSPSSTTWGGCIFTDPILS